MKNEKESFYRRLPRSITDGGDGGSGDSSSSFPISKGQIGIWILLTAIIMLFAGLSSAYIVLRGVPTWQNIELPSLLWPNTAILLMSSVAIELSRRAIRRGDTQSMKRWLGLGGVLGLAFLVGQAGSLATTGQCGSLSAIDAAE